MSNSKLKKKFVRACYKNNITLIKQMMIKRGWLHWYMPDWFTLKIVQTLKIDSGDSKC